VAGAPTPSLPTPLPIGTLAEYVETANLGQWVQVPPPAPPGSNVLEIPGGQLLEISATPTVFYDYAKGNCPCGIDTNCDCVMHDATTQTLYTVAACGYGAGGCMSGRSCPGSGVGGGCPSPGGEFCFDVPNCAKEEDCQGKVDALRGQPLSAIIPLWWIEAYRPELLDDYYVGARFTVQPDWWSMFCGNPERVVIPNPAPTPTPASCAAPAVDRAAGGACPSGYFVDPNNPACCTLLDPPLPYGGAGPILNAGSTSTDPMPLGPPLPLTKAGPIHPTDCGCDEDRATEDEIGYEMVEA
jgi:hypothetical protein